MLAIDSVPYHSQRFGLDQLPLDEAPELDAASCTGLARIVMVNGNATVGLNGVGIHAAIIPRETKDAGCRR
jgi:hypothetical protein